MGVLNEKLLPTAPARATVRSLMTVLPSSARAGLPVVGFVNGGSAGTFVGLEAAFRAWRNRLR
jgi:hypothetical protein